MKRVFYKDIEINKIYKIVYSTDSCSYKMVVKKGHIVPNREDGIKSIGVFGTIDNAWDSSFEIEYGIIKVYELSEKEVNKKIVEQL